MIPANDTKRGNALSLTGEVATGYGLVQRKLGTISLIGPVQMDYAAAIDIVRAGARELSRFAQDVY